MVQLQVAPVGTKYILRTINNPPNPNTARPATPSPITEPPVKETDNAFSNLYGQLVQFEHWLWLQLSFRYNLQ